jgi:epsilon-lactone hydrolase
MTSIMKKKIRFPFRTQGKIRFQLRSIWHLYASFFQVVFRRIFKGPLRQGWSLKFEMSVRFIKLQTSFGFEMSSINDSRAYEDALKLYSPARDQVTETRIDSPVKGDWIVPDTLDTDAVILYLHGGGYAYYADLHKNMMALLAQEIGAKMFALDYRLIPEHPYPAQLEDALAAYDWLSESGHNVHKIVVMGDSAGGNLCLSLLLKLRESGRPQPALAVCIAPWTDIGNQGKSLYDNDPFDWVDHRMPIQWAQWLVGNNDPADPFISPIHADLRDLAPIYIQDGDTEILHDMIVAFHETAKLQGAAVELDTWKNMVHDFQAFGDLIPESREAIQKIKSKIKELIQ